MCFLRCWWEISRSRLALRLLSLPRSAGFLPSTIFRPLRAERHHRLMRNRHDIGHHFPAGSTCRSLRHSRCLPRLPPLAFEGKLAKECNATVFLGRSWMAGIVIAAVSLTILLTGAWRLKPFVQRVAFLGRDCCCLRAGDGDQWSDWQCVVGGCFRWIHRTGCWLPG